MTNVADPPLSVPRGENRAVLNPTPGTHAPRLKGLVEEELSQLWAAGTGRPAVATGPFAERRFLTHESNL